jgi:hypothetical protein
MMVSLDWDCNSLGTKLFILIPLKMNDVNNETYLLAHNKIGECVS